MSATLPPVDWPVSSAHSSMAPLICLRLLMQAFCCAVARALMKLGMAIAASRPMMATTIMISTRVKPALREVLFVFMFCLFFVSLCGVNDTTGGLHQLLRSSFTDCLLQPQSNLFLAFLS